MRLPYDTSGSKNNVQAMGSSVSYGKRYVLSALLNIVTRGEDDDAESAAPYKRVSPGQAAHLQALLELADDAARQAFAENHGDPEAVPERDYPAAKGQLAMAIHTAWCDKARTADSEEALTATWQAGVAAMRKLGDMTAYHEFKDVVTERGKALQGGAQ